MKIQVASDLHLEFADLKLENAGADVLVLAGDICVAEDFTRGPESPRRKAAERYLAFFEQVSKDFDQVVYVMGNHEFYHGKWNKTPAILKEALMQFENIHLLDRDILVYKGVTFLGATLWTDMHKEDHWSMLAIRDMMNDYSVIVDDTGSCYTRLKPATTVQAHKAALGYFNAVLQGMHEDDKVVIVSHHAPSFLSVHEKYKNDTTMNGAYASDLSEFILDRPQIKLWVHGHMHDQHKYTLGETQVVCNPRGYPREYTAFDPKLVLTV